jgi:hypothetical protein
MNVLSASDKIEPFDNKWTLMITVIPSYTAISVFSAAN